MEITQHPHRRLTGMTGFTLVWIGQIVSVLASGMTTFAMTIYMYQQTRSATAMAFVQVAYITPFLIMSPIAGVMVDRYNRKLMMMVSDIGGGTATLLLLILFSTGHLLPWHIYLASVVAGLGTTFQWPAYSAAISTMIPKEQYGRANGMMSLIEAGPGVLSPFLAGALIPVISIGGILLLDTITFWLAILALAVVFVPQPPRRGRGKAPGRVFSMRRHTGSSTSLHVRACWACNWCSSSATSSRGSAGPWWLR
jgi:DHA3 family macrolide efflux protein-like MFS transporter